MSMFNNYLKTASRNLTREKTSSIINIAGLTMGITCSLVLFLLVRHHFSYDTYHSNADRIYRIVRQAEGNQRTDYTPGVPSPLPDAFRIDFPEAEEVVFTSNRSGSLITIPQEGPEPKRYQEEIGTVFTQSNFFKIFDRAIIKGDKNGGLDNPNEAIISKRSALKYFGKEDVIGEVVEHEKKQYKITAVMEDYPVNTDFPFDLMLSYATIKKETEEHGWGSIWSDEQCYFMLKEDESIAKVESRVEAFRAKHFGKENDEKVKFSMQPLNQFHFDERYEVYSGKSVAKPMLIALAAIALILVITACINFINLSTAEAIKRSKEVGIRKSLGGTRGQLVRQFLGETTLITLIAMVIALGLTQLALTYLNPFLEVDLSLDFFNDAVLWIYVISVTVVIALCSGLYPAFIVSGFNPVLALKNVIGNKSSSSYALRRTLVVTQFVISQFFIIGTIIVVNQTRYFQNKSLGFKKDAILMISVPEEEDPSAKDKTTGTMRTLREEIARLSGVEKVSLNSEAPSSGSVSGTRFRMEGKDDEFRTQVKQADGHYIDLFELKIIAGENIKDGDTATGFVVNEKLVSTAGFSKPEDIIGKTMDMWGRHLPVVGVVKDFHAVSLRRPIEAIVLMNDLSGYSHLAVQINPAQLQNVIGQIRSKWETSYPEHIFDYQFLDEQIREFYEGEQRMSVLLTIFSSIAIFIGCLGLFGLATFMANQKTKEIGVRKVMGASVESILLLFSREYVKLIGLSFLLAAPMAWFVMTKFLEEFTYRITIGPGIFITGLLTTLLIATITVGFKSFRAAVVNPAQALRSE